LVNFNKNTCRSGGKGGVGKFFAVDGVFSFEMIVGDFAAVTGAEDSATQNTNLLQP